MSRSHMLYDDKALSTLPVKTTTWDGGVFNLDDIFKRKSGTGLIIEGRLHGRSRHVILESSKTNTRNRLVALHVEVLKATRRKFDSVGKEIEPDFGSSKIINTGYLSSSYQTVSKEGKDILTPGSCVQMLSISKLDALNEGKYKGVLNIVSIWCNENEMDGKELNDGCTIRLRTKGEGSYLESVVVLDYERQSKVNYSTGEAVGGSWTEKVLTVKDDKVSEAHLTDESKAIDDDEWDD